MTSKTRGLMAILLLLFVLSACTNSHPIEGSWQMTTGGGGRVFTWEFMASGQGTWRVMAGASRVDGSSIYSTTTYTWSIQDNILEVHFAGAAEPQLYYFEFLSNDVFLKTSIGGITPGTQIRMVREGANP